MHPFLERLRQIVGRSPCTFGEKAGLKGAMEMVLQRGDGSVEVLRKDNIIVDLGFGLVCDALGKDTGRPAVLSHIAVGTDPAAPVAANAALGDELLRKQVTYTKVNVKQFTLQVTFGTGEAVGPITEAGVFNAATGGTMFDRVTFNVVNKGSTDTLTVTFTFTLS